MTDTKEFISKGRLDALTDGVFAFAMTLLVVNLAPVGRYPAVVCFRLVGYSQFLSLQGFEIDGIDEFSPPIDAIYERWAPLFH